MQRATLYWLTHNQLQFYNEWLHLLFFVYKLTGGGVESIVLDFAQVSFFDYTIIEV